MNEQLEEIAVDWIDCQKHIPEKSGYYEVTACDDIENVIKYEVVAYLQESEEFLSIATLFKAPKKIINVRYWRNVCNDKWKS